MKILVKIITYTAAVLLAMKFLPGVNVDSNVTAGILIVALIALNTFIRPILKILTFPISMFTLGLFSLVMNTVIVLVIGYLIPGVTFDSIFSAFLFSLVFSIVVPIVESLEKKII